MAIEFEWDREKAETNLARHGVPFSEATTVFDDPLSLTTPDRTHSVGEERFWIIGHSARHRLLVVAHSDDGEVARIISARLATAHERQTYEQSN